VADALLTLTDVARTFDVSPPWLNRVVERKPRTLLKAVDGVSFAIAQGETLGLVGESGCGKSTVARLIVGLYAPTRGRIEFDGVVVAGDGTQGGAALRTARRGMQMIFQDPYASLNPRWRVADIVAEPIRALAPETTGAKLGERVRRCSRKSDLPRPTASSIRISFPAGSASASRSRALSTQPRFLVCDEPASALDVSVQAQVLNLMRDLQRRMGLTYLFISHNLAVVHHRGSRRRDVPGRIAELAPTQRLFAHPLHPYTRMLLAAVPDLAMTGTSRTAVAGEVPNPLNPPSGCAFHPRCPFADDRCRREVPALKNAEEGGAVACHAVDEGRLPPPSGIVRPESLGAKGDQVRLSFPFFRLRESESGLFSAAHAEISRPQAPLAPHPDQARRVQVVRRSDVHRHAGPARRHRRTQRLRQVQRYRRGALGARRIEGLRAARRVDAGRHLQRRRRGSRWVAPRSSSPSTTARAASEVNGASTSSCRSSACCRARATRRTTSTTFPYAATSTIFSAPASAARLRNHRAGDDFARDRGQSPNCAYSSRKPRASPSTRNDARRPKGGCRRTRNLSRVEDIRIELGQQLEKLDAQAKVATEYRESEARLKDAAPSLVLQAAGRRECATGTRPRSPR
jgi:peptide/nickel transport system ATP-binding protein